MWECDYKKICKLVNKYNFDVIPEHIKRNYIILKEHINNLDLEYFKHINPREAFSGGRTNAARLYYKVDEIKG